MWNLPGRTAPLLVAALLAVPAVAQSPTPASAAAAAPAPKFIMATHQPQDSLQGQWVRRIYAEAFRRLGIPLEVGQYPLQRMTQMLDRGELDGDVGRVYAYADDHPQQVRVEEPMYGIEFGLFALGNDLVVDRLEDLATRPLQVVYVRGVAICERLVKPHVPERNLSVVALDEQGLAMLALQRADLYCTADHTIAELAVRERFRVLPPPRLVLSGGRVTLHPYLARKHEALAPRLAAVLRDMRREGVIEKLRLESIAAVSR